MFAVSSLKETIPTAIIMKLLCTAYRDENTAKGYIHSCKINKFPLSEKTKLLSGTCIGYSRKVNVDMKPFSCMLSRVGQFGGQSVLVLGRPDWRAPAATDPIM